MEAIASSNQKSIVQPGEQKPARKGESSVAINLDQKNYLDDLAKLIGSSRKYALELIIDNYVASMLKNPDPAQAALARKYTGAA